MYAIKSSRRTHWSGAACAGLLPLLLRWLELPGSSGNRVLASPDLETNTDTLLVLLF